ncbi:hypothetical protein [Ornithinibacillus halotolerans]|uniref:DUF4190 domain-containing protein n=1 Tax=Ornithinibacillus halotolerans TaxID=1274357 RepID=A0A916W5W9_9BACI|nr:hypothetical protein [Ornithinibacillus halotolerans]GGA68486.1 hypothetical protein GCM10008025_10600 [Ornithinibacillus halotolerans]
MDDKHRTDNVEKAPQYSEDDHYTAQHTDGIFSSRGDEETAAELTADDYRRNITLEDDDGAEANTSIGWIALALSIASFFWAPILLGGAGIIVGFIARNRHANTLGNIAIAAGAISILITLFILPFV